LSSASFRKQSDHELDQLSDEKLIAYLRDASRAGDKPATDRALALLIYGHAKNVERRMLTRLPRWAAQDAAHDAIVRAITSAFDGTSEGEFHSWLNTIIDRTAVDWFRRRERRPVETRLPSEHAADDEVWGREPESPSETGAVELQLILAEIMAELSPKHRQVVELHVLDGHPAAEVCRQMDGMSADNVAQIASRFRKRLREVLEEVERGTQA
jgi:RNA polymerase sigma factor (sigma-70 family)